MTQAALKYFAKMFEADREMDEEKWYRQFPMYQYDDAMGAKLW